MEAKRMNIEASGARWKGSFCLFTRLAILPAPRVQRLGHDMLRRRADT
jgi:hypothetical protein